MKVTLFLIMSLSAVTAKGVQYSVPPQADPNRIVGKLLPPIDLPASGARVLPDPADPNLWNRPISDVDEAWTGQYFVGRHVAYVRVDRRRSWPNYVSNGISMQTREVDIGEVDWFDLAWHVQPGANYIVLRAYGEAGYEYPAGGVFQDVTIFINGVLPKADRIAIEPGIE